VTGFCRFTANFGFLKNLYCNWMMHRFRFFEAWRAFWRKDALLRLHKLVLTLSPIYFYCEYEYQHTHTHNKCHQVSVVDCEYGYDERVYQKSVVSVVRLWVSVVEYEYCSIKSNTWVLRVLLASIHCTCTFYFCSFSCIFIIVRAYL